MDINNRVQVATLTEEYDILLEFIPDHLPRFIELFDSHPIAFKVQDAIKKIVQERMEEIITELEPL